MFRKFFSQTVGGSLAMVFAIASFFFLPLVSAQEAWNDHLKYFYGEVELQAPSGYRVFSQPQAGLEPITVESSAATVKVIGFVEADGFRYYLTEAANRSRFESQIPPTWIFCGGTEVLPALPELVSSKPGIDPDSGEDVIIELYAETGTVSLVSSWPAPSTDSFSHIYPAAVMEISQDPHGMWALDLQLFGNGDADLGKYPFHRGSPQEMMDGKFPPRLMLLSRPDRATMRLEIGPIPAEASTGNRFDPGTVIQPGMVFLAAFDKGRLVRLSAGRDAWSQSAPVSLLSAPLIFRGDSLAFGFLASTIRGDVARVALRPDLIAGADYTKYDLIAKMGPPFDDFNPVEAQKQWTLHLESDLSTRLLAPLWDGRGAPGMLELEGINLDPVSPEAIYSSEEFEASRSPTVSLAFDPSQIPQGWISILQEKLGPIPASQQGPETEGAEF